MAQQRNSEGRLFEEYRMAQQRRPIPGGLPDLSGLTRPARGEEDTPSGLGPQFPHGGPDYQALLERDGFVVVPTALGSNPQMLDEIRAMFDLHFYESPELLNPRPSDNDWLSVQGGFGALGNPSSFHHPFVRGMREMCEGTILDADVLPLHGRRLEQCFDRLMRRVKGQAPMKESWHRDESMNTLPGDDIFGGWINLDLEPQYFSCAPGTHLEADARDRNAGFAKITDPAAKARYQRMADAYGPVAIPPGHILVFYERLAHEVVSVKAKRLMRRMFLGWRATTAREPLFGTNVTNEWMTTQHPPMIKSGQKPQMYGDLHENCHQGLLLKWSTAGIYVPQCISPKVITGTANRWVGQTHPRIHRYMKSLVDYGLPLHSAYDLAERMIMMPQYNVTIRTFDSPRFRVQFQLVSPEEWQAYSTGQRAIDVRGRPTRRPRPVRVVFEVD